MVWIKRLENDDSGDSTHLGGNNWDTLDKYFDDTDISASITNPTTIATPTTYKDGILKFRNAANTFSYTLKSGTLGANADVTLPAASGNITLIAAGGANDFGTEMQTFRDDKIKIMNPANTYGYIISTSAIVADRTITIPLLAGNDTMMLNDFTATVQNKTINIDQNTVKHSSTNTAGDILIYNSTSGKYVRLARGSADQLLKVNAGGTDVGWETVAGVGEGTVNTIYSDLKTSGGFKYGFFMGTGISAGGGQAVVGGGGYGLLGGLNCPDDFPAQYLDATTGLNGMNWSMSSSTGDINGMQTNGKISIGKLNPDLEVCFQLDEGGDTTGSRVMIGFTGDLNETSANDAYLDSDIGVMLYKSSANDYFTIAYNDGDATAHYTSSVLASDSNPHTIRLISDQSVPKWSYSIDGAAAVDITTDIPAITDTLGVIFLASQADTTARNFRVFWAKIKQKERVS
jgi:hypothetical protein